MKFRCSNPRLGKYKYFCNDIDRRRTASNQSGRFSLRTGLPAIAPSFTVNKTLQQESQRRGKKKMEGSRPVVKHILLAKFKDDISSERKEQLIRDYANLVSLIEPMKAFQWGTNVSAENLDQGFTHVFESTFESVEGVAEYVAHPAHVEYATEFLACLDKVIVIDYKPTVV
ncbi:hypothetical protein H6P81_001178 [Aristolochia fimbriata]|uniref:Stress-response A/B barrel domain-containing protein n=1 Tax=Aristolochia fimbriata TaxID=158543 RepID=A0AAV7F8T7_ARIFI|nr:hypothetical protein H6P81_001178 [Aristolochia fimbriata]